jgi:hypothetical protein
VRSVAATCHWASICHCSPGWRHRYPHSRTLSSAWIGGIRHLLRAVIGGRTPWTRLRAMRGWLTNDMPPRRRREPRRQHHRIASGLSIACCRRPSAQLLYASSSAISRGPGRCWRALRRLGEALVRSGTRRCRRCLLLRHDEVSAVAVPHRSLADRAANDAKPPGRCAPGAAGASAVHHYEHFHERRTQRLSRGAFRPLLVLGAAASLDGDRHGPGDRRSRERRRCSLVTFWWR